MASPAKVWAERIEGICVTTQAGWFPDPHDPTQQRYWDGQEWTDHRAPVTPPPPAYPPPPQVPSSPGPATHAATAQPRTYGSHSKRTWVIVAVGATAFAVFALISNQTSGEDDGEPSTVQPAITPSESPSDETAKPKDTNAEGTPQNKPFTVGLKGEGNTAPMTLSGGDYRIDWKTGGNCYYGVDLTPTRGPSYAGDSLFTADKRTSGTQYLYGVKGGDYFIEAITGPPPGCPWEVTFIGIQPS